MLSWTSLSVPSGILLLLLSNITTAQKDNGEECSCFRTNASAAYFTNHIFRDFRNLDSKAVPEVITGQNASANAHATSDYFLSDEWNDVWATQSWNNSEVMEQNSASVLMINSPNNVYIEPSNDPDSSYKSYLTLRTSRQPDFQSAAEIDSTAQNYQYLSMRFLARVIGSPGACAGIFTYVAPDTDEDHVQEADIEILTSGPRNMVQYTNQPSDSESGHPKPQATRNSTNPGNRDWTLWNTYRYDWTPEGGSQWYVNGVIAAEIKFQAPKDPTQLMLNMWSDGGAWMGNMSVYDQAYLQIQWMQIVFNTSGPATGSDNNKRDGMGVGGLLQKRKGEEDGCQVVCAIDEEVKSIGTPVELYNSTGVAPLGWKLEGTGSMVWIPLLLVAATMLGLL